MPDEPLNRSAGQRPPDPPAGDDAEAQRRRIEALLHDPKARAAAAKAGPHGPVADPLTDTDEAGKAALQRRIMEIIPDDPLAEQTAEEKIDEYERRKRAVAQDGPDPAPKPGDAKRERGKTPTVHDAPPRHIEALRARLIAERKPVHDDDSLASEVRYEWFLRKLDDPSTPHTVAALTCPENRIPTLADLPDNLTNAPESVHDALAADLSAVIADALEHGLVGHVLDPGVFGRRDAMTESVLDLATAWRWEPRHGAIVAIATLGAAPPTPSVPLTGVRLRLYSGGLEATFSLAAIIAAYELIPAGTRRHPLAALLGYIQRKMAAANADQARIEVLEHRNARYTKGASLLDAATLAAVEVDGAPVATATPAMEQRRVVAPAQGELFAAPRRIAGRPTGDMVFEALSQAHLTGDERSYLRNDLRFFGRLVFALWRCTVQIADGEGSRLLTGADTPGGRQQWRLVVLHARYLSYRDISLFDAELGPDTALFGPARWWQRRQAGGPGHWVLTGGLFRRSAIGATERRGGGPRRLAGAIAIIDGLEAVLVYGNYSVPIRPGGSGPELFVPWHGVLRQAGEPVSPDTPMRSAPGYRYGRRVEALDRFVVPQGGATEAPAGDSVEIVKIVSGNGRNQHGGNRETGIVVRLSARYLEARQRVDPSLAKRVGTTPNEEVWSRLQVSDLL